MSNYTEKPATVGLLIPNEYGIPNLGSRDEWDQAVCLSVGDGPVGAQIDIPQKYWGIETIATMIDGVADVAGKEPENETYQGQTVTFPAGSIVQLYKLQTQGANKGQFLPSKLVQVSDSGWTEVQQ